MNLSPLFWTLGLQAVIVTVLLASTARARTRLKKQYPPIGEMVDIGGYRLHMHVEGEGSPTVVLDAGGGGIGLTWELVRPAVAKMTRVVVYDRAGLGWSDPSPRPRDAFTMAEELHSMLVTADIAGLYILVGHSLGGPIARQFAARYPDEVAGLVMVDSAHEQQAKRFPERLVNMFNSMKLMVAIMKMIGRIGIEETLNVIAAKIQPVSTLGDLPLTVISHGQLDANAVPPSLGQEVRDEYERAWQELQEEITALSKCARRIVAERSGHNVIFDQPELVIASIFEMVNSTSNQVLLPKQEVILTE